jgi:hypothetical protein
MKLSAVLLGFVVACGGSSAPAPQPVEPTTPVAKRVPIEEPDEDEGPQDGVQIQSTRGRMDQAAIESWRDNNSAALAECYTSRVGRRRWLGGHVVIHWDVDKAGEVKKVVLAESDLGNRAVEKCLLDLARAGTFGKPIGGEADFSLPLEFSAKGSLLSWDEDQALRAVGGQLSSLDECEHPETAGMKKGRRPIKKAPPMKRVTLPSDVVVTVYVGPGGKAQSVGFASAKSEIDDAWAECAEKLAMGWRLTDPRGVIAKLAIRYRAN